MAPRDKAGTISRRAVLAGFGVLAGAGLAGCSAGTAVASSAVPDGKPENLLNVYSWGDYSDPADIKRFTKKHGPSVQIASFGSNQEMIAKLSATRGTSGYDIVVPTGLFVPEMAEHKLLQKLDKSRIPNFSAMDPAYIHQTWDPDSEYAICKASGTTGFMYDTTAIKRDLTSWSDFLDAVQHEASGKTALQTDPWEVCCCYLAAHGKSPNTTDTAVLDACEKFLVNKIAPHIKAYLSTATSAVSQGGFTLLHAYNGDARQAIMASKHPDKWKFVYPTPTANLWMDTWAIARGTQHPDAAYEFINYMLEPDVSFNEMQYIGYATGVGGVEARARREKVKYTELIFPADDVMKRLTPSKINSATERLNEILNKTKARSGA
nr:spermidine/putrescine ABC transporter substrate-binding protein [Spelaeicoccus albus]